MKKISVLFVVLMFTVSFSYAQKSAKSEKFYSKNWRVIKPSDNSSWSSLKPKPKNIKSNIVSSSKSKALDLSNSHSKPKKIVQSNYPNSSKKNLSTRGSVNSGSLLIKKISVNKSFRSSKEKKKLFSERKNN